MQFTAKLSTEHDGFVHAVNPVETRRPQTAHELLEALIWIEECQSKGLYVGGFFTYEAAIAFDDCHAVHRGPLPLAVLASYREVSTIELEDLPQGHMPAKFSLQPRIDKETYEKNLQKTLRYIKEGDIYQANLSFRCDIGMAGDSYETFCALYQRHPVPYAAYCNDHEIKVCSLSPELFVSRRGNHIISDPMKGTCPRGLSYNDDKQRQQQLADDTKTRAENVMIVDLMRNDLSRIARTGTVKVPELFKVTPFRSLFQMTSRVSIESDASLSEIMNAVYPPGSITGAPKIRAMEIIQELEDDARGVYTGSMAWFEPNGNFTMNVAIRTLVFNGNNAELGLGSGVVADSDKWPEWEECLLKGDFLKSDTLPREIFETALLENGHLLWLPEHLKRLRNSCRYFKRPFPRHTIFEHIREGIRQLDPNTKYRCRLAVDPFGRVTVTSTPLDKRGWQKKDLKLRLSKQQLNSLNPLLYHKTDKREIYNEEFRRAAEDGFDEVLFFNEKQEICEGAISNIVIEKADGCKITPALRSGLLPGIWRQHQLNEQKCREDVITIDELRTARSITIGNSFRLEGHVSEIIDADGETIFTAK